MKIKLDENIPSLLQEGLSDRGHDVDTVHGEGVTGRDDMTVWEAAQEAGRFLITQDLDFSDVRKFEPGTHHGLLLVRLREPGRLALARRVSALFSDRDVETWRGCLIVATDRKLRIRKPANP